MSRSSSMVSVVSNAEKNACIPSCPCNSNDCCREVGEDWGKGRRSGLIVGVRGGEDWIWGKGGGDGVVGRAVSRLGVSDMGV